MKINLFRGKHLYDDQWTIGYYVQVSDFETREECSMIIPIEAEVYPDSDFTEFRYVDPMTVGQYIGLTDKRGTNIFEGDILGNDDGMIMVVRDIRNFEVISSYVANNWRVVGNIFDNPELIRKG